MHFRPVAPAASLVFALLIYSPSPAALAQSPIVSYPEPPSSIEELWRLSDVVASVRVVSTTLKAAAPTDRASARPTRQHTLEVRELLKGSVPAAGLTMVQELGFAAANGSEVIVFLQFWKSQNTFAPTYGPPGIFPVEPDHTTVDIPESMRRANLFGSASHVSKQVLLERLRSLKEKR